MGNRKFKLSDMIPNAWFFKLKDMGKPPVIKPRKHPLTPPPPPPSPAVKPFLNPECQSRKSYHFTREHAVELPPEEQNPIYFSPRKSKSRKSTRRNPTTSSVSTTTTTATYDPLSPPDEPENPERFDIVIDVSKPYDLDLPRIVTKLKEPMDQRKISATPSRRFPGGTPAGVRLKVNSPRIMSRKQGQNGNLVGRKSVSSCRKRRSVSESFAVVKSSRDPHKDFKVSMMEMIVENNLTASKDLEDLLACYLCLNSDEYHDVIIKVFKQIWFDVIQLRNHKLVS